MNDTLPLLYALRRLNSLQAAHPPEWVREISPGEMAVEVARLTALLPASLTRHHEQMMRDCGSSLSAVSRGRCVQCGTAVPRRMREQGRALDVCDGCGRFLEAVLSAPAPVMEEVLG